MEVKVEILCLGELFHRENSLKYHSLQAFNATYNPYTMYLHEAMKELDWNNFMTAMVKEATYQINNGNFSIIPKSQVTTRATILPAV